jgi:hypothetical protein
VFGVSQALDLAVELGTRGSAGVTALLVNLVALLLSSIATFVLSAALVVVVGEAVLGRRISIEATWQRVRPRLWAIIGASLLTTLLWGIASVFFLLPGIYFYVALSLAVPAVVLEGQPVGASVRRSFALVHGAWWRTFGILLLGYLVRTVVSSVITIVLGLIGGVATGYFTTSGGLFNLGDLSARSTGYLLVLSVIGFVAATVTRPIFAGVVALVYVDRRIRSEGLDVTLAEAARGGQPGTP